MRRSCPPSPRGHDCQSCSAFEHRSLPPSSSTGTFHSRRLATISSTNKRNEYSTWVKIVWFVLCLVVVQSVGLAGGEVGFGRLRAWTQ
ncbi:hypothetical protein LY78DRAFT_451541 [Colletotrichum sublineola]|nr:hypothetical protein LY78DRAFT_451541 [Colletotrichum sublineola]